MRKNHNPSKGTSAMTSPSNNQARWPELYEAHFGKALPDRQVEVWNEELRQDFSGLTDSAVARAVKSIAEDKRTGQYKSKYAPTVDDIKSRIIRLKYEDKRADLPDDGECSCTSGWIVVVEDDTLGDDHIGHRMAIPCICDAGQRRFATNYPNISQRRRDYFTRLRRERRFEDIGYGWSDKPTPEPHSAKEVVEELAFP